MKKKLITCLITVTATTSMINPSIVAFASENNSGEIIALETVNEAEVNVEQNGGEEVGQENKDEVAEEKDLEGTVENEQKDPILDEKDILEKEDLDKEVIEDNSVKEESVKEEKEDKDEKNNENEDVEKDKVENKSPSNTINNKDKHQEDNKELEEKKPQLSSKASALAEKTSAAISNDNILLEVTERGNYRLYSRGKRILYGNTNMEAIKVGDEVSHIITPWSIGVEYQSNIKVNNSIVSKVEVNGIEVTRTMSIVKGSGSSLEDTIKISYALNNKNNLAKNVSYKLMLDTLVDGNDYAPFSVPGHGQFDIGKNLTGNDVPNYWFAYDSLENPEVISKGTLKGTKPDRIAFTNWGRSDITSLEEWDKIANEGRPNGDSAVVMDWNNMNIGAGQTKVFSTEYGISDLNVQGEEIKASLLGGKTVELKENNNEVFDIYETSSVIKNSSACKVDNVTAEIVIPEEFKDILSLTEDSRSVINIGELEVGEEILNDYKFNIKPIESDKDIYYDLVVKINGEVKTSVRQTLKLKNFDNYKIEAKFLNGNNVEILPNSNNLYNQYELKTVVDNKSVLENSDFTGTKARIIIPEQFKNIISLDQSTPESIEIGELKRETPVESSWKLNLKENFEDKNLFVEVEYTNDQNENIKIKQDIKVKGLVKPIEPEKPEPPVEPEKPEPPVEPIKPVKPSEQDKLPSTGIPGDTIPVGLSLIGIGLVMAKKKK